jgi:ABC-type glucose/galactose transport system permease subunit
MIDRVHSQQLQIAEKLSLYVALVARLIIISCRQVALLSLHFIRNVVTVLLRYFLPYSFY